MNDFITIFLQAVQRHKFSDQLEDLKLEVEIEPFPRVYFTVNQGALVFSQDFTQADIILTGTIAQWSQMFLSGGKDRAIKVEGDASSLQAFQKDFERICQDYQNEVPSFLEVVASNFEQQTESHLCSHYLQRQDFDNFKKSVINLSTKIDALEQKIAQRREG